MTGNSSFNYIQTKGNSRFTWTIIYPYSRSLSRSRIRAEQPQLPKKGKNRRANSSEQKPTLGGRGAVAMPTNGSVSRAAGPQFSAATAVYANSVAYHGNPPGGARPPAQQRRALPVLQGLPSRQPPLRQPARQLPTVTATRRVPPQSIRERAKSTDCVNGGAAAAVAAPPQPPSRQPLGALSHQLNGSNATLAANAGRRRSSISLSERGLVGLSNLGNTCYMNSILQCLSHTQPLLERFMRKSAATESPSGRLSEAFKRLIQIMWSSSAPACVSPAELRTGVARLAPRFRGSGQQDSQEFLRYLLDGLHEDLSRVGDRRPRLPPIDYQTLDRMPDPDKAEKLWNRYLMLENSPIVDIFVGQLKSTLECCHCHHKSTTFDPFWDLALPIPRTGPTNLGACLELFTTQETLDGNERPKCDNCRARRSCLKSFSLYRLPRILVIHLMRFSGDRFKTKLNTLVNYPLKLDLAKFVDSDRRSADQCSQYSLYAVSQHAGTPYGGHYTALVRHAYAADRWLEFNDSMVSRVTSDSAVSSQGYVLFYEMQSP